MAAILTAKTISILAILLSAGALGVTFFIPGPQGPQGPAGAQGTPATTYKPTPQTRQFYILVIPDMGGDQYDKFDPGTITVNQNDTVHITIRNTDPMMHGFNLQAYGIDVQIAAAFNDTTPTDTVITSFVATIPGVFLFYCDVPCGAGHTQMMGYLTVLPRSA